MSLARSTIGAAFLRPFICRPVGAAAAAAPLRSSNPFLLARRTYASGDYGSGEGSPVGENPQDQGANPSADLEHPGPPPPSAGQGSGGGPTKGTSEGHGSGPTSSSKSESSSSSSSSSASKSEEGSSSSGSSSGSGSDKGKSGAQPKILSETPPAPEEQSSEVKQHNKEMDNRADKAFATGDKADGEKDKAN